jgi:hypothetical protein
MVYRGMLLNNSQPTSFQGIWMGTSFTRARQAQGPFPVIARGGMTNQGVVIHTTLPFRHRFHSLPLTDHSDIIIRHALSQLRAAGCLGIEQNKNRSNLNSGATLVLYRTPKLVYPWGLLTKALLSGRPWKGHSCRGNEHGIGQGPNQNRLSLTAPTPVGGAQRYEACEKDAGALYKKRTAAQLRTAALWRK